MNYFNASVMTLLRGPLLLTPQGWVVIASALGYFALALLFALSLLAAPLGKSTETGVMLCICWPFIVFLLFVKQGAPYFKPSWAQAAFIAACALSPAVYAAYLVHEL